MAVFRNDQPHGWFPFSFWIVAVFLCTLLPNAVQAKDKDDKDDDDQHELPYHQRMILISAVFLVVTILVCVGLVSLYEACQRRKEEKVRREARADYRAKEAQKGEMA